MTDINATKGLSIDEAQKEVISEFIDFDDWMDRYQMLIDLGNELGVLDEKYKTEQNIIDKAECGFNAIIRTENWCLLPTAMR